ncbi:hypothetical protein [Lyticum sinuosum]|uniref:LPS export ABC transporter periplasmic protein LptC n=1 Tax=Lyticum sinuosum TaxID=1332059 RepID=A0AAE4VM52_9RICK|nr:hypothetical protein [Lyticum sinuosum]MDZ5761154.1 hypothetical protein [Lyticum sinuosum]
MCFHSDKIKYNILYKKKLIIISILFFFCIYYFNNTKFLLNYKQYLSFFNFKTYEPLYAYEKAYEKVDGKKVNDKKVDDKKVNDKKDNGKKVNISESIHAYELVSQINIPDSGTWNIKSNKITYNEKSEIIIVNLQSLEFGSEKNNSKFINHIKFSSPYTKIYDKKASFMHPSVVTTLDNYQYTIYGDDGILDMKQKIVSINKARIISDKITINCEKLSIDMINNKTIMQEKVCIEFTDEKF